jgi:hypothetical protein
MTTQDAHTEKTESEALVRTSVLIRSDTDQALRDLCKGKRPLSWEIREALEKHVEKAAA